MAHAFVVAQSRERRAATRAAFAERPSAVAMRNTALPIQSAAAAMFESRHDATELRMHAGAVIALVVVFEDDLPVGGNVVTNRLRRSQFRERIACDALRNRTELRREGRIVP